MTTSLNDEMTASEAAVDFLSLRTGIPHSFRTLTPGQANITLRQLCADKDFAKAAIERGTPSAEARLWLNAKAHGKDYSGDEVRTRAAGLDTEDVNDDIN